MEPISDPLPMKELEAMPAPEPITLYQILGNCQRYGLDTSAWTDEFKSWLVKICNDNFKVPMPPRTYSQEQIRHYLNDYLKRT